MCLKLHGAAGSCFGQRRWPCSQLPSLAGPCRSVLGGAGWWPPLPDLLQSPNPVPSESQRRPSTALWSPLEPGVGSGSGLGFSSLGCARWVRREEAVTRAPQGRPEPSMQHPRLLQDCGWVWALAAAAPVQCSRLVAVGPSGRGVWGGCGLGTFWKWLGQSALQPGAAGWHAEVEDLWFLFTQLELQLSAVCLH